MPGAYLWAWDSAAGEFVKVLVDASGHLQTDVLSQPDVAQDTPESLKHTPHGYYPTGGTYHPFQVDSAGKLLLSIPSLGSLDDIDDVNVPTLVDGDFIEWDTTTSKWIKIAHKDAATGVHGVGAGSVVGTTLTQILTNKTLTTPIIASIYQDAGKTKLLTLPAAIDTLVGKATTDTLTNKTLTSPTINGTIATTGLTMPAFTLGGTLTLNGQIFDAGAVSAKIDTTGSFYGCIIKSTNDGAGGAVLFLEQASANPAVDDRPGTIAFIGRDSGGNSTEYNSIHCVIDNPTNGSEDSKFRWYARAAGELNEAMRLSGAGILDVDASSGLGAATVGEFDKEDDIALLNKTLIEDKLDLLCDIGVMSRKDTGSGYMLSVQKGIYLSWGAIRQLAARVEELERQLAERRN